MWNAMTFSWMTDGIPIVYYGQEQRFTGIHDPGNREALWPSAYEKTSTVDIITKLNKLRDHLVLQSDWLRSPAEIISFTESDVVVAKGYVVSIMTNVGSPPANVSANVVNSGYPTGTMLVEVIDCHQMIVGSQGSINVDYLKGGKPNILVPAYYLRYSGLCEEIEETVFTSYKTHSAASPTSSLPSTSSIFWSAITALLSLGFLVSHVV